MGLLGLFYRVLGEYSWDGLKSKGRSVDHPGGLMSKFSLFVLVSDSTMDLKAHTHLFVLSLLGPSLTRCIPYSFKRQLNASEI